MPPTRRLNPQSVWDKQAVLQAFDEAGVKSLHATRLWGHLIRHPESTWSDVVDMPKAAVDVLNRFFTKFTTTVLSSKTSSDGGTTKLLITLQDGMQVESVVMTYEQSDARFGGDVGGDRDAASRAGSVSGTLGEDDEEGADEFFDAVSTVRKRSTLCVSSQVGCQMGCTFCATGTMGLKGNLSAGEIVEQLVHARAVADIKNIVFMGMGEPLNNYEAVKSAVGMMTDSRFFGLKRKKVTVSTVGIIPRIKQLSDDLPGVSLALSLHAPTQDKRLRIVPSARAFKLPALMDAVKEYQARSRQRVFVEYVVLAGENDGLEEAHELGQLLQGMDVWMNLIPWNPVYQPQGPFYEAPPHGRVAEFQAVLRHQYGVNCTVRQEKGQDISGACGQLVLDAAAAQGSGCARQHGDIEDSSIATVPRKEVCA